MLWTKNTPKRHDTILILEGKKSFSPITDNRTRTMGEFTDFLLSKLKLEEGGKLLRGRGEIKKLVRERNVKGSMTKRTDW